MLLARSVTVEGSVIKSHQVTLTVVGRVVDAQDSPIDAAKVRVLVDGVPHVLLWDGAETEAVYTDDEGLYVAELVLLDSQVETAVLVVEISKPTYRTTYQGITRDEMALADDHYYVETSDTNLPLVFNAAFFLPHSPWSLCSPLIAFRVLHDTVAAFLGAAVILGVSYLIGTQNADFWIMSLERAIEYIDWDVIFLIMSLMIVVVYVIYRRDYVATWKGSSHMLLARLEENARITDSHTLKRGLLVLGAMLLLFFAADRFHMPPSVVGFIGAAALLVWVRPDVEEMMKEVDWTTLMFFICLFIIVGAVQEIGLIQWIAELIAETAGGSLLVASLVIIWLSTVASAIVNNTPFTTFWTRPPPRS